MEIRPETPSDHETIHHLTKAAFEPMPFSDGSEARRINALRDDGDLTLSLVAIGDAGIVGHIAFSPVSVDGHSYGWFGLGPVSVWPHLQKKGIGSRLVNEGLDQLRQIKAEGCVLIGDPGYYSRFGFQSGNGLVYRDLPSRLVQWLAFGSRKPSGVLRFSQGLE
jgi:putative acetyltransferase